MTIERADRKKIDEFIKEVGLKRKLPEFKSYIDGIRSGDYVERVIENVLGHDVIRIDYATTHSKVMNKVKMFIIK